MIKLFRLFLGKESKSISKKNSSKDKVHRNSGTDDDDDTVVSMATTMENQLIDAGTPMDLSVLGYNPMLSVSFIMLGYEKRMDAVIMAWTPGYRLSHLSFKHSADVPECLMGETPFAQDLFAAIFAASNRIDCHFCAASSAFFALGRGLVPEFFTQPDKRNEKQRSLVEVSESLALLVPTLNKSHLLHLSENYSDSEMDFIALSVAVTGMFNTISASFELQIEDKAIKSVAGFLGKGGWNPGRHAKGFTMPDTEDPLPDIEQESLLSMMLKMLPHMPGSIFIEQKWIMGIPSAWPSVGKYLERRVGYNFPILGRLCKLRRSPVKTYTVTFKDHFDPTQATIDPVIKSLAALIYATAASNEAMMAEAIDMANHFAKKEGQDLIVDDAGLDRIWALANEPLPEDKESCATLLKELSCLSCVGTKHNAAALVLARASSSRPIVVPTAIVQGVASKLSEASKVEMVMWIGHQQCFLRTLKYIEVKESMKQDKKVV